MQPATNPGLIEANACCDGTVARHGPPTRDPAWQRHARLAHRLAWVSLAVMLCEGVVGLWQGLAVGSIALTGWALGSVPEGLASAMVIWRFSGSRTHCQKAERRAQIGVAVSFWLTAPYIAAESVRHLFEGQHAETSTIGIALTALALVLMPTLGWVKHNLGARLGSGATKGEGTQNYLCAAQAAGVLVGLAVTATWSGAWWVDPAVGLAIAAVAVWQGFRAWRGLDCGC
ncbi:cation transporter [Mycobacterium vicinigordonae]|uniref:Cation transporter n=1 Tax=Mycobacterium vicinigordonae TaxID=1719132 RepID=A0A7D6E6U1_9MYCO|nr:cation transporter [Mycobacterium vicinigordonae]QLL08542.1 cation transporter [Mycobacterium vicinigordonae]